MQSKYFQLHLLAKVLFLTWFSWVNLWIIPSEFAWLLFATALSVLFSKCTEKISRTYIVCCRSYLLWPICSIFNLVTSEFPLIFLWYLLFSLCSLQHNGTGERKQRLEYQNRWNCWLFDIARIILYIALCLCWQCLLTVSGNLLSHIVTTLGNGMML